MTAVVSTMGELSLPFLAHIVWYRGSLGCMEPRLCPS
jgi:hypothetical protein